MKNFFKNKTLFPYNSQSFPINLWREPRLVFISSPDDLPANEVQWHYMELDELESVAGTLSAELLPKTERINDLREKQEKGTITPTEQTELDELEEKNRKLERLQKIIAIRKNPRLSEFLDYTSQELDRIHKQKSREAMIIVRKGRGASKDEQTKLGQLREEIDAIALILEERDTLTGADAEALEKDLKSKRIPEMQSTEKQTETLEQMIANTSERRQDALNGWKDQMKYIGTLEDISDKLNGTLKKLQGGALSTEDKKRIDHVYRTLEGIHKKLGGALTMETLEKEADEEVRGVMIQTIQGIKEHRDAEFKHLLETMEKDFAARIKSLEDQWNSTNLHPALKAEQKEHQKKIKELKETLIKIRKLLTLDPGDDEYQKILRNIQTDGERLAHRKHQLELLQDKKEKYTKYIQTVTDRLAGYDYIWTTSPPDPATEPGLSAEQRKLYPQISKDYLEKKMDSLISTDPRLSGKSREEAAKIDPDFNEKYYKPYSSIASRKIRDDALRRSLQNTLTVTNDRLDQLAKAADTTLYDEDDHYNLRLTIEDQLRKYEDMSIQKFKDAQEIPVYEDAPEWTTARARFGRLYDTKRKLFDRGAPENEVSPYQMALKELEKIHSSGVIDAIRGHLSNPNINLTDDEKTKYENNLQSIEKALPFLKGDVPDILKKLDLDEYVKAFTQDSPPGDADTFKDLIDYLDNAEKQFKSIKDYIGETKKLHDNLTRFEFDAKNQLTAYSEVGGGSTGGWASINDIIKLYELFDTSWRRLWERDQKAVVGEIGSVIFDLPKLHAVAHDSRLQVEQAENEAVNQYKETYNNMDAWAIQAEIPHLKNKDYLKAAMLSLADKGRLNFENVELWKVLSKFSGGVVSFDYSHPERETDDYVRIEDKIRRSMIAIWGDEDLFNQMSHTNESNLKSKMESYNDIAAQRASNENGLSQGCSLMLENWIRYKQKGQTPPGFDPAEYEEYIRYGTDAGKMDPHAKFYYLLQGVRHGILPRKRLGAFSQDFSAVYPVMEFFDSHWPWEQLVEWADTLDGPGPNGENDNYGPGIKYKTWYHGFLLQDQTVNERLRKIMSEGKSYDHDEICAVVTGMGDDNMNTLLRWRSSAGRFAETGLQNMAVGMLFGMQVKAMQLNKYPKTADKDLKRFLASWIRFHAITGNLMFQGSDDYVKFNKDILEDAPRASGSFPIADQSTGFYVNKMNEYVAQLDPFLFSTILSTKKFSEKEKGFKKNLEDVINHLKTNYSNYHLFENRSEPKSADDLFNMMGEIVSAVVDKAAGEDRLKHMIEAVQNDLAAAAPKAYEIMINPPPPPYAAGDRAPIIEEPIERR